jgi:hypothetical protein
MLCAVPVQRLARLVGMSRRGLEGQGRRAMPMFSRGAGRAMRRNSGAVDVLAVAVCLRLSSRLAREREKDARPRGVRAAAGNWEGSGVRG